MADKVEGFKKEIDLWKNRIDNGDKSRFTALHEFLVDNDLEVEDNLNAAFVQYHSKL